MKRLLFILLFVLPIAAQADVIRIKCGTVSADSCNDWYFTRGLNGAPHNPAADANSYYVGFTGAFERQSTVTFPSVAIGNGATIDSAYLKSCWVTTDSTIKPVVFIYGWKADAADTIVDSTRWRTAYNARTTAVDSMYDSLWARATTAFAWAKTWNMKTVMQELVNQTWWTSGHKAVFVRTPRAGTTGDRSFSAFNASGGDSLIVYFTAGSPPVGGGGTGPRVLIRKP